MIELLDKALPYNLQDSPCAIKCLAYFFILIGLVQILNFTIGTLSLIYRHFIRKPYDLLARYGGKDSWAVVTGGSDGVGLQFCKDLAARGFNICIVSRDEKKMQEKLEEIKKSTTKQIKTKSIVADFFKFSKIQDYEKLASQLKDLDIGILILNAGWT